MSRSSWLFSMPRVSMKVQYWHTAACYCSLSLSLSLSLSPIIGLPLNFDVILAQFRPMYCRAQHGSSIGCFYWRCYPSAVGPCPRAALPTSTTGCHGTFLVLVILTTYGSIYFIHSLSMLVTQVCAHREQVQLHCVPKFARPRHLQ